MSSYLLYDKDKFRKKQDISEGLLTSGQLEGGGLDESIACKLVDLTLNNVVQETVENTLQTAVEDGINAKCKHN